MTLGEIKTEALRLMYINEDRDIRSEDIEDLLSDDEYKKYLVNMWGAINRCFADLENKGVIPVKCVSLSFDKGEICCLGKHMRYLPVLEANDLLAKGEISGFGENIRFDIPRIAEDFLAIDRLVYENAGGEYDSDAPYRIEGDTVILPVFDKEREEYRLYYHPRINRVKPYDENNTQIDIPRHIAEYIPYFIKGEMFVGDEPTEAAEAHNVYENGVTSALRSTAKVARSESKYSQIR